ncbi:uncharacterized protein [Miscanthus floridulus]|uniref:uncharacterized protein n=1 Tax=Miscanthus floridulus TaxID=154761 RepID=UPI00345A23B1
MADREDVVPGGRSQRRRAAAARLGHNSSIGEQLQIGAGAAAARVGQSSTVDEQSCAWRSEQRIAKYKMDRSWIFGAPFTPAYVKGVEEFMQFVSERYPKDSQILCPCSRCLNQKMQSQHDASDHIHIYGMSATYTRWIHHGESADTEVVENLEQQVEGRDHDFGIHVDVADDDYDEDHGVPEMIGELYAAAEAEGQQPMFARVLEDAKKSLSPGSRHSKFSFLVRMLYIKSRYRIGNTTFSAMIKLLSEGYPQSELPKSYDEAKKYLRELGLGCENIHVCPNNCVLFRKRYAKDNVCPVCKASRWQDETGTKRVPHKVLRHFPLLPRLKRIFASKRTSKETQWHQKKRTPVNNVMSHPADGEAWKDFDRREKTFASDPRNLRLALATDGFNPFGNMSTQYSPKSPGKDFDVFLEPLIEDLIDLWKGVRTFDACTGKKFDLRAAVLWCIHDYPALSTLSGRTTKGYYACIHCDKDPLSRGHAWRRSLAFDGKRENKDEPGKFTLEEVLEELEKVKDVRPGKHPDITRNKRKRNEGPRIYSRKGKTKDTTNARLDLYDMGIRPEFHLQQHGNSVIAPPAPIIPTGLRGLVRKDVYEAVAEIETFFRELCSRNLRIDVVKRLKQEIPLILCKLEKIFPPAFFDVMVHLAVHLPDEALLRGPIQYGWMYPIERRLGTLKNFHGVTLVGSDRRQYIDDVVLNKLVCLYRADLEEQGARDVDRMVEKGFAKWFKCHIANKCKENPESVSEGLWALSCGPDLRVKTCAACKVNGVRYSTVDREKFLLTQNSGVLTEGSHNGKDVDFYGVLKEDEYGSDTEHVVQAGAENEVMQNIQGGEATITEGNLEHLIKSKKQPIIHEDSEDEEEDETIEQYCSDGGNENNGYMSLDDEDDDL